MMQELEEFLEKQRDLNIKMIQELMTSQNLLQHNLTMGLDSLKKCIQILPTRKFNQFSKSRITQTRQFQHNHILKQLPVFRKTREFELLEELPELYRDRIFSIHLKLRQPLNEDEESGMAELKLFTSEKFPQEVSRNISGKPIFKGMTQIPLQDEMEFQKIQITEVSSHFPSSKFILVVYSLKVKPLIIDNIIVKAKKMEKKL